MKSRRRLLLVVSLLLGIVLLVPGLLGLFVHRQVAGLLAEDWPEATVRWQRGWFTSRVEAADADAHLLLRFRHPPLDLGALMDANGQLTLSAPAARIDVSGRFDWALGTAIDARAPTLEFADRVSGSASGLVLDVDRRRDGRLDLRVTADRFELRRAPDARLDLRTAHIALHSDGQDPGRLAIELDATRSGAAASRLRLAADTVDRARAAELASALSIALRTPPESAGASLAWLGVASAWEQLARAGLAIELAPLDLDGRARIEGRWVPADGEPELRGEGELDALAGWIVPISGLLSGESEARLYPVFELQIEAMAGTPGLRIEGGRFELDRGSPPVP